MGRRVKLIEDKIFISKKNLPVVLLNILSLKDHPDNLNATMSLEEALEAYDYTARYDTKGNLIGLSKDNGFDFEDYDIKLFKAIAPLVRKNSYLRYRCDYENNWQFTFDGSTCIKQKGKITYK